MVSRREKARQQAAIKREIIWDALHMSEFVARHQKEVDGSYNIQIALRSLIVRLLTSMEQEL